TCRLCEAVKVTLDSKPTRYSKRGDVGVLRELRLEGRLSQETLALEAGLQRNYISLLERGLNSASLKTLFKLAPILGIPVSRLLERVEIELAKAPMPRRHRK
ncbi:MAG: helix-turn-helix domain-containing protein, partial [Rhodanobacter sp.]